MPYLSGTLRPQGTLLSNYSVLDQATTPNGIAAISGQPPNKATEGRLPGLRSVPLELEDDQRRDRHRRRLRLPGRNPDPRRPARSRRLHLARLHGRDGQPDHRRTGKLRLPRRPNREVPVIGGYSAQLNPFAHFHSLLDLGACATNDVPITELKKDLKSEAKTRELLLHLPRPLLGGRRRAVPGRGAGGRRGGRRLARRSGAGDRRIAGLQEGRPADRHLRRRQPAGTAGRRRTAPPTPRTR